LTYATAIRCVFDEHCGPNMTISHGNWLYSKISPLLFGRWRTLRSTKVYAVPDPEDTAGLLKAVPPQRGGPGSRLSHNIGDFLHCAMWSSVSPASVARLKVLLLAQVSAKENARRRKAPRLVRLILKSVSLLPHDLGNSSDLRAAAPKPLFRAD
jgi:hypothetical protein